MVYICIRNKFQTFCLNKPEFAYIFNANFTFFKPLAKIKFYILMAHLQNIYRAGVININRGF